jgi:hypothetical protein
MDNIRNVKIAKGVSKILKGRAKKARAARKLDYKKGYYEIPEGTRDALFYTRISMIRFMENVNFIIKNELKTSLYAWVQKYLADGGYVGYDYLVKIKRGDRPTANILVFAIVARRLGKDMGWLFDTDLTGKDMDKIALKAVERARKEHEKLWNFVAKEF